MEELKISRKGKDFLQDFQCFSYKDSHIYIHPEKPDWFVPTQKTHDLLQYLNKCEWNETALFEYAKNHEASYEFLKDNFKTFLSRFEPNFEPHSEKSITNNHNLKEIWIHLTNQCNMSCSHCLFSSSPENSLTLPPNVLEKTIKEALELNVKIFYFTGGEPFIYPEITKYVDLILFHDDKTNVVFLTNGKNIKNFEPYLLNQDPSRIHFQMSIDGMKKNHEQIRGKNSFDSLIGAIQFLKSINFPITLALTVNEVNKKDLMDIIDFANAHEIKNIHLLWIFIKGNASKSLFIEPQELFKIIAPAYKKAKELGINIDNFEIFKSQVFSIPGTRFDGSNSGIESITVGPDEKIYPSPSLALEKDAVCGDLSQGLSKAIETSELLKKLRYSSLIQSENYQNNPFKYLIGGGDLDHSFVYEKEFLGHDPYVNLYNQMILALIHEESVNQSHSQDYGLKCKMGEKLYECQKHSTPNQKTRSNCVLSISKPDGHTLVNEFYSEAAINTKNDILNPVTYDQLEMDHIPKEFQVRSYGCGSPVFDAGLKLDEHLLDLGSGTGIECFIAAKKVGKKGQVYGVDMSENMLQSAQKTLKQVERKLGFSNVQFLKGYLEKLTLDDNHIDCVISNCVINLSPNKRKTFLEINRVLKPGGRLCISDIVRSDEIPIELKYDKQLKGECIGGAMLENDLFAMLNETGFESISIKKRFVYRIVQGYTFYSLTYIAFKKQDKIKKNLIYRGPFKAVLTDDHQTLPVGIKKEVHLSPNTQIDESFFVLNDHDQVTNIEEQNSCCCTIKPLIPKTVEPQKQFHSGCMVCGEPLKYFETNQKLQCHYCEKTVTANSQCQNGHFICDQCHFLQYKQTIENLLLESTETDMITLFNNVRNKSNIPINGPEHHILLPGVILVSYRNSGHEISDEQIKTALQRGSTVPGGSCAFTGACGAIQGIGIAFAVLLGSTPYKGKERSVTMTITSKIAQMLAETNAPRCCLRDCYIALKGAAKLSKEYLPHELKASDSIKCNQMKLNKECMGKDCPLFS